MSIKLAVFVVFPFLLVVSGCDSSEVNAEAFCAAWSDASVDVDPKEVGSAEANQLLRAVAEAAPDNVRADVETLLAHLESDEVDFQTDPTSVNRETFPEDVSAAAERVEAFASENC